MLPLLNPVVQFNYDISGVGAVEKCTVAFCPRPTKANSTGRLHLYPLRLLSIPETV